jgi:tetratricopeptide (TPR) repeat protein
VRERGSAFSAALRELTIAEHLVADVEGEAAANERVAIRRVRANVRKLLGQPSAVLDLAEETAKEAERLGNTIELAKSYQLIDWVYAARGEPERAILGKRSVALYEELGELELFAAAVGNQGATAYWIGHWDEAIDCYRRAEQAWSKLGNIIEAATAKANAGELHVSRGEYDEATPLLRDAARTHRAVGYTDGALFDEIQLGRLATGLGDVDRAISVLTRIRTEANELRLSLPAVEATAHLGDAFVAAGRSEDALAVIAETEAAAREEATGYAPALNLVRARALAALDDLAASEAAATAGIVQARAMGALYELGLLLMARADVCEQLGTGAPIDDRREGRALLDALEVAAGR